MANVCVASAVTLPLLQKHHTSKNKLTFKYDLINVIMCLLKMAQNGPDPSIGSEKILPKILYFPVARNSG